MIIIFENDFIWNHSKDSFLSVSFNQIKNQDYNPIESEYFLLSFENRTKNGPIYYIKKADSPSKIGENLTEIHQNNPFYCVFIDFCNVTVLPI